MCGIVAPVFLHEGGEFFFMRVDTSRSPIGCVYASLYPSTEYIHKVILEKITVGTNFVVPAS